MRVAAVSWVALAACHVTAQSTVTRPARTELVVHRDGAIARRPTLVLAGDGRLRFVEPLECPSEQVVAEQRALEIERRPNLATFVVGVIATAAGGILVVRGTANDGGISSIYTAAGATLLGVGIPLAVGPWLGTGSELREIPPAAPVRRPTAAQPCGERGLAARHATLSVRGIEVFGAVDGDGYFAVSPFAIVDAFAPATAAWNIAASVDAPGGARTVDVVLDGPAFAAPAARYLARADFDATIEPLRVVPNLVPGPLRVSLTTTASGPAARIALAVKNEGPGAAYALRGQIAAPATPALDGRIVYFGRVDKGATVARELLVPLSPAASDDIRNATLEVALELRDAHGTAPTTPVRLHGPILVDAPR